MVNHYYGHQGKIKKKEIKDSNTISKLLNILEANKILKDKKFQIKINKRIPNKAGLGGGSMNAANILKFFLISVVIGDVEQTNLIGTEMAWIMGPLSFQGEYIMNIVDADQTYNFTSYYCQISYFLTGEKRKYKNSLTGFDRVSPEKNLGNEGMGALELAARYSSIYLSEANGGILNNITLGLNWYLNPSTRIMFNYVMGVADLNSGDINENTFQMRMQIDF